MLTTLKDLLTDARENHYAVPAFDCVEDVMVRAILQTAEAERAPVILMCLCCDLEGNGMAYLPPLIRLAAEYHSVPAALHLDHATDLDLIKAAVDNGFTGVMFDGSQLPFEENVRMTRAAVEVASPHGVSVEAELGFVGGMDLADTRFAESVLTEPAEVARFVEETGVDALAISIGTSHGVYRSLPKLNIGRLKELDAASPIPLVLHGGSGTPDRQVRESVAHGICKMNVYADCRQAMGRGVREAVAAITRKDPVPNEIFGPIRKQVSDVVRQKIRLLSAENRVE